MAAGASPDGLVGDDGLLEIKCPNPATHIDYLRLPPGECPKAYFWQVQARCSPLAERGAISCRIARSSPASCKSSFAACSDQQALAKLVMGLGKFLKKLTPKKPELRAMMTKVAAGITLNEVPQVGSLAKDLMYAAMRATDEQRRKTQAVRLLTDAEKIAVRREARAGNDYRWPEGEVSRQRGSRRVDPTGGLRAALKKPTGQPTCAANTGVDEVAQLLAPASLGRTITERPRHRRAHRRHLAGLQT